MYKFNTYNGSIIKLITRLSLVTENWLTHARARARRPRASLQAVFTKIIACIVSQLYSTRVKQLTKTDYTYELHYTHTFTSTQSLSACRSSLSCFEPCLLSLCAAAGTCPELVVVVAQLVVAAAAVLSDCCCCFFGCR